MSKKKIKKSKIPKTCKSRIKPTSIKLQGISFSFKYYEKNHDKFVVDNKQTEYWLTLLERLRSLSSWSVQELLINRSSSIRFHPIKWEDTSEKKEFRLPDEEQLVDIPYQFSLSSNQHGRVHGFFIDQVFYIVWLDPDHLLYPSRD